MCRPFLCLEIPMIDRSHYFYRTVIFSRHGQQVALANIDNPTQTSPLDPWLGNVVSLADGSHTVAELIAYLARHYPAGAPSNLEDTVMSVLERLLEGKLVAMSEGKVLLPYYLAEPIENLDLDKARQLIREDGYIQH